MAYGSTQHLDGAGFRPARGSTASTRSITRSHRAAWARSTRATPSRPATRSPSRCCSPNSPETTPRSRCFAAKPRRCTISHHEAIVRYYVFTIEPVLRRPYLAMEFVEGQSALGSRPARAAHLRGGAIAAQARRRRPARGARARHRAPRRIVRQHHDPGRRRRARQDHRLRHRAFHAVRRSHHHRRRVCRQVQLRLARAAWPVRRRRAGEVRHLQSRAGPGRSLDRPAGRHGRQPGGGARQAAQGAGSRRDRPAHQAAAGANAPARSGRHGPTRWRRSPPGRSPPLGRATDRRRPRSARAAAASGARKRRRGAAEENMHGRESSRRC